MREGRIKGLVSLCMHGWKEKRAKAETTFKFLAESAIVGDVDVRD